jgi:hypothetical protein
MCRAKLTSLVCCEMLLNRATAIVWFVWFVCCYYIGPAFDQFAPHEAIVEIKNLFSWANKTRNGLLLFIDECDSFLEDRATLSPERVRVLNEFINQTGTESRKVGGCCA